MSGLHAKAEPTTGAKAPSAEKSGRIKPSLMARDSATGQFLVGFAKLEELRLHGFSNDEIYKIVGSRRTLARRKERNETLTGVESDRALRLERVSMMADRVFGDHEKAQRWLRKRSRVLNETPIDLLQSETGATLVEEELHRIDYGIFS
jgi:putative toxin-antitoxin system antitoxin component (TIGR02293 family)